jgi:hypothetical protein
VLLRLLLTILFASLLQGCGTDTTPPVSMEQFCGRDEGSQGRQPLYRARVPAGWLRQDTPEGESIADTTKSLCSFTITEAGETIHITIHNFPTNQMEERIPPLAQVARWRRQVPQATFEKLQPQAYGGFSGICVELCDTDRAMLAWSMQLAPEHYQQLIVDGTPEHRHNHKQMRSDYTIKAVGPVDLMQRHKKEIVRFARSFELIEEIPSRP